MDCWEHDVAGHGAVRAVAVCAHCGVGLCAEHASVCAEERTVHSGVGGPSRLLPNGRQICCPTCREAFTYAVPAHEVTERTAAAVASPDRIAVWEGWGTHEENGNHGTMATTATGNPTLPSSGGPAPLLGRDVRGARCTFRGV